jgi:hypothetical protein
MRTLLGMQYGGNVQQQYPRRELQFQPQSFQEGGDVPSAYKTSFGFDSPISPALASLLRGKKKREAFEEARTAELDEIEKRKRSGLWGSIGGLGGGLLASTALGALGFTPAGIPLALAAGLGTGLGKAFGSKTGYEGEWSPGVMFRKAKSEKAKDIMYGKEAGLEDIERAGRDYTAGIDTEAGVAGLTAALMAGFAPEGGIYGKAGKFGGKFAPSYSSGMAAELLKSAPSQFAPSAGAELAGDLPVEELSDKFIDSGVDLLNPKTELDYLQSLPRAKELGEQNFLLDMARTNIGRSSKYGKLSKAWTDYIERRSNSPQYTTTR